MFQSFEPRTELERGLKNALHLIPHSYTNLFITFISRIIFEGIIFLKSANRAQDYQKSNLTLTSILAITYERIKNILTITSSEL